GMLAPSTRAPPSDRSVIRPSTKLRMPLTVTSIDTGVRLWPRGAGRRKLSMAGTLCLHGKFSGNDHRRRRPREGGGRLRFTQRCRRRPPAAPAFAGATGAFLPPALPLWARHDRLAPSSFAARTRANVQGLAVRGSAQAGQTLSGG